MRIHIGDNIYLEGDSELINLYKKELKIKDKKWLYPCHNKKELEEIFIKLEHDDNNKMWFTVVFSKNNKANICNILSPNEKRWKKDDLQLILTNIYNSFEIQKYIKNNCKKEMCMCWKSIAKSFRKKHKYILNREN